MKEDNYTYHLIINSKKLDEGEHGRFSPFSNIKLNTHPSKSEEIIMKLPKDQVIGKVTKIEHLVNYGQYFSKVYIQKPFQSHLYSQSNLYIEVSREDEKKLIAFNKKVSKSNHENVHVGGMG